MDPRATTLLRALALATWAALSVAACAAPAQRYRAISLLELREETQRRASIPVRITLADGRQVTTRVIALRSATLVGTAVDVPLADARRIELLDSTVPATSTSPPRARPPFALGLSERGITLRQGVSTTFVGFGLDRLEPAVLATPPAWYPDPRADLPAPRLLARGTFGLHIGVLDDLELALVLLPLGPFALEGVPGGSYGSAGLSLTYRAYRDAFFEVGVRGQVLSPGMGSWGERALRQTYSAPMRMHIAPAVRLDLTPRAEIFLLDSGPLGPGTFVRGSGDAVLFGRELIGTAMRDDASILFGLDVELVLAPVPELFFGGWASVHGPITRMRWLDSRWDSQEGGALSVIAFAGATVPLDRRPLLDVVVGFGWPALLAPGRDLTETWQLDLALRFHAVH